METEFPRSGIFPPSGMHRGVILLPPPHPPPSPPPHLKTNPLKVHPDWVSKADFFCL